MNKNTSCKLLAKLTGVFAFSVLPSSALHASAVLGDTFGIPGQQFTIEFLDVGNSYNPNDTGPNGGPYGGVKYDYQMGKYEISQDMIAKAAASGLTGVTNRPPALGPDQPSADITWFEAAAFVNWLNTSKGHQAAYKLNGTNSMMTWSPAEAWVNDPGVGSEKNLFRHKSAYYVLPSEDEWYKAAFYDPLKDGIGGYWDFATKSDSIPVAVGGGTAQNSAVFKTTTFVPSGTANVNNAGGLSAYGTTAQNGNVFEWSESAFDGENDYASENRIILGGGFNYTENYMRSKQRTTSAPANRGKNIGFRVATVPEPSSALLLLGSVFPILLRRQRAAV